MLLCYCQNLISILRNQNRMLELGRIASVLGLDRPFVGHELGLVSSYIDHGFYREYHPWLDEVT